MKKIKDTFISILLLGALVYGAHNYSFLTKGGFSSAKQVKTVFNLRNEFVPISIKLDSLQYSQGYGEGSPDSYIYLLGKINGNFFELYESPEKLINVIENNGFSIQTVWFNKDYFNVFLKKTEEVRFPWKKFVAKYIFITLLFLCLPICFSYYLLKNIFKLLILIYKKEYYNVEDTEDK